MFGKRRTYLDWAAAAPVGAAAWRAYGRAARAYGNPSSPHEEGREAKRVLEDARTAVARELMVKADDVIFTSGATESNNIAIQGVAMAAHARGIASPHVLYLPSMHASVVEALKSLTAWGVAIEPLAIKSGRIDIGALKQQLKSDTVLVCADFICGETGTRWNVRDVRRALDAHAGLRKSHIYLHVDASQAPWTESLERTRLAGDLITLDAQKAGGVRGTGVLAMPRAVALAPVFQGGGQERGVRPGTPNAAGAAALAAALQEAGERREAFAARAAAGRARLVERIAAAVPDALVNEGSDGVPHILNLSFPGRDTDYLVALLDEAGFAVSTKSACESNHAGSMIRWSGDEGTESFQTSGQGSRAVMALTGDAERAKATLRVSWGPATAERDLDRFSAALVRAIQFLDAHGA
jgi:cysteine desulfurase